MLWADLIRIRIAWIAYTRPHNGLSRRGWGRRAVRAERRVEATLLLHVYYGSPPRNMIYNGVEELAAGLQRFPKIPQASGKSNEQRGEVNQGVRGTGNVIPRAPRANYVKIWCGSVACGTAAGFYAQPDPLARSCALPSGLASARGARYSRRI